MYIASLISNLENEIIRPLIAGLAVIATILFMWGVFEFIRGSDDSTKRNNGIQHMLWGVVGLGIMFGANGIVQILKNFIGVN